MRVFELPENEYLALRDAPAYDAVIPAPVRYDGRLSMGARLLYGEIRALSRKEGFCWASNRYFAEAYSVHEQTISTWISELTKAGHISVEIDSTKGNRRVISLRPMSENTQGSERKRSGHLMQISMEITDKKEINKEREIAEEIYKSYPRKVAKPIAIAAIQKQLKKFPAEMLLAKTKAFSATRNGDLKFCPHPSTWFNQERFNDDPETWKPNDQQTKPKFQGNCI